MPSAYFLSPNRLGILARVAERMRCAVSSEPTLNANAFVSERAWSRCIEHMLGVDLDFLLGKSGTPILLKSY